MLGITFKENCPDVRNSKVDDILKRLKQYDISPLVCDPWADAADAKKTYGVELVSMDQMKGLDAVIVAVAHDKFVAMNSNDYKALFVDKPNNEKVLVDVKSILNKDDFAGYRYWRL